jgi:hypothetical protein
MRDIELRDLELREFNCGTLTAVLAPVDTSPLFALPSAQPTTLHMGGTNDRSAGCAIGLLRLCRRVFRRFGTAHSQAARCL